IHEAEEGIQDVITRLEEIRARSRKLDDELRWVYGALRQSGATAAEIADQASIVREEQTRLRTEIEPLEAQIEMHRLQVPKAEEIKVMCRQFVAGAENADAQ